MKKKTKGSAFILTQIRDLLFGGKEYRTVSSGATPLPIAAIAGTVLSTVLVLMLIFSFIEISSLSSDIASLRREMVDLTTKEGKLHDDLNHKYPYAELEGLIAEMGFTADGGQTIILEETEENENE